MDMLTGLLVGYTLGITVCWRAARRRRTPATAAGQMPLRPRRRPMAVRRSAQDGREVRHD